METLLNDGVKIQAYDPDAMGETQRMYGQRYDLVLTSTKEATFKNSDALLICTEWGQFRVPDFDLIYELLSERLIVGGRNTFDLGVIITWIRIISAISEEDGQLI